jgi:hypothetical protein
MVTSVLTGDRVLLGETEDVSVETDGFIVVLRLDHETHLKDGSAGSGVHAHAPHGIRVALDEASVRRNAWRRAQLTSTHPP